MSKQENKSGVWQIYGKPAIGFVIIAVFWLIPPIEPLTPVGMKVVGAFLGMIVLWSIVGNLWPSLMGLFFIALSGYAGEGSAGFKKVFASAFSNDTILLVMFAMILFGAMSMSGVPKYVANWVLTRRIINGRPYIFMACIFLSGFVLAAFTSAVASLIILLPIAVRLLETLGLKKEDQVWSYIFVGLFMSINFGRPFLPYKGAVSAILSTYNEMIGNTNDTIFLKYMLMIVLFGALFITLYLLVLKFIVRPDINKLCHISVELIATDDLPPMKLPQKLYLLMVPLYILMLVLPSFLPKTIPGVKLLSTIGPVGISIAWLIFFNIIHNQGKPLLSFKEVAAKQFNWGVFFMIPASIYGANALASDEIGFKELLLNLLEPLIGGQSEWIFIAIIFAVGLLVSNFASNTSMALVLLPVIMVFCEQMALASTPVVMGLFGIVFAAMLTPGASPQTALMFGWTDIYKTKDILKIGIPVTAVVWFIYVFVGYPFLKILFVDIC